MEEVIHKLRGRDQTSALPLVPSIVSSRSSQIGDGPTAPHRDGESSNRSCHGRRGTDFRVMSHSSLKEARKKLKHQEDRKRAHPGSIPSSYSSLLKETLAVGADHSSALAETTWDFETGDLVGWRQTGDAFALQPTFGDNPYFRTGARLRKGTRGAGRRASKTRLRGR